MRRITALALVAALGLAGACGGGTDDGSGDRPPTVIAAFYPLAFMAERLGGDLVDVENVTPAGAEPHDLELTPDQVDAIEDADVVLYVGGGFQPAIEEIAERQGDRAVDLLRASGGTGAEDDDPHVWLDPTLLADAVPDIAERIARAVDDDQRSAIDDNRDALVTALTDLHREFGDGLQTCERRAFVTSHDAFGRLAAAYDLEQLAVAGLSPESEPDAQRLDELTDEIESRGITTVFYEELVSSDVAETLAREAGVKAAVLSPLEGLTDAQVENDEDYLSVMRENLDALREALECS